MKRHPYGSIFFPQKSRKRGMNYKEDKLETNSKVYCRNRRNKYQWWSDGYSPVGLIRGRRGKK